MGPFDHYPYTPNFFNNSSPYVSGYLVVPREPTLIGRTSDVRILPTDTSNK